MIGLIDKTNTAAAVWADTAYRSRKTETWLAAHGMRSCIHRKKPLGRPMPRRTALANAAKSRARSAIDHVLARQKGPMGLFVRTIGIARAATKIGLANLTYNMQRLVWLSPRAASGYRKTPTKTVPKIPQATEFEPSIRRTQHRSVEAHLHTLNSSILGFFEVSSFRNIIDDVVCEPTPARKAAAERFHDPS